MPQRTPGGTVNEAENRYALLATTVITKPAVYNVWAMLAVWIRLAAWEKGG